MQLFRAGFKESAQAAGGLNHIDQGLLCLGPFAGLEAAVGIDPEIACRQQGGGFLEQGETATSAFSINKVENSTVSRVRNASGNGAQANIEARGAGTSQPARPKLSTSTSRRRL